MTAAINALYNVRKHPLENILPTDSVFDHFSSYTDAQLWTKIAASSGTTAFSGTVMQTNDGVGSNLLFTTAATAFDYQGVALTNAQYLPVVGNPIVAFQTRVKFTSQSANNALIFAGLSSSTSIGPASNVAPTASYSGAIIYRLSGDTYWSCQVSNGSTKTTKTSGNNILCADGEYNLGVEIYGFDVSNCIAQFFVNGIRLKDGNNQDLNMTFAYSGLSAMKALVFCEAAGANAQTMYVDYIKAGQSRAPLCIA